MRRRSFAGNPADPECSHFRPGTPFSHRPPSCIPFSTQMDVNPSESVTLGSVMERADAPVGVAILTFNRREEVLRTIAHAFALPERPPVVVVDNGSTDGTGAAVRSVFPWIHVVRSEKNLGAAGR